MAGESIGCTSRKKSKSKKDSKNENNGNLSKIAQHSKTTRGGLRVYKIVILGDGGVGKSGKAYPYTVCVFVCRWKNKFNEITRLMLSI